MILSDRDIKAALAKGEIVIDPFDEKYLQPASYDLHLDQTFLVFKRTGQPMIDLRQPVDDLMEEVIISDSRPFILHPGEFVLANLAEVTGVSDKMVGRLEGKSSLGRLGVIVHATAGFLDPGNELKMTLELSNIGVMPVTLYLGMPIAQMAFETLSSPAEKPYGSQKLNSKYRGAEKVQASQMWRNFKTESTKDNAKKS